MTRAPDLFCVIDKLVVGPVRLEPKRVTAVYTVESQGRRDQFELIYRWEETVFRPDDPDDLNLAAMITAQVAFNYGLFCREIVFDGRFDAVDRRFIEHMMENTSREIWVNKLLGHNPFLVVESPSKSPRLDRYTRARLTFRSTGDEHQNRIDAGAPWPRSSNRVAHAVLSSGGKDSLLSYGMLKELGCDVHPVFINESGRHWYTALRAFRHFRAAEPNTSRVWTNCDRVFSWMLRHLPFVRADFDRVRADIYPIRLWTVAVFLFGALPLLRARGISRLVIGNEYDTSVRRSDHGITHYDGLYDQSRWFDHSLSRYFHRKKWGVSQFSILRSFSELLIEKILASRYPELLRRQMSCHAAHIVDDEVLPCSKCEKCRRIVAMLTGLGTDPAVCGYTPEQIRHGLEAFQEHGVKQEAEGINQLKVLLFEKGVLSVSPKLRNPEVLKVRFHPERAPFDAMPSDIRRGVYDIAAAHAQGAVERLGRVWVDIDLSRHAGLERPYAFESANADQPMERIMNSDKKPWLLGELSWPEARQRFKEVDLAILPVGAIEQHGPHSPLDTDAFDAAYLAEKVAERCSEPKPLVLPLIPYGVSYHHDDFPGTISVGNDALSKFVHEVGMSAARNGITKLVIVNGHGGNTPALQYAAQMINRDAHIFACVDTGETSDADIAKLCETPNDVHAGEIETSTTLAIRPHLIAMDKAKKYVPKFSIGYLEFSGSRSVEWYARTKKISPQGTLGDPTKATAEKGRAIWEIMIKNLVEFVEHLKEITLDEIHQRRY